MPVYHNFATNETQCFADYAYGIDGEWCRNYCPLYGTGKCRYDATIGKMMVKDDGGEQ